MFLIKWYAKTVLLSALIVSFYGFSCGAMDAALAESADFSTAQYEAEIKKVMIRGGEIFMQSSREFTVNFLLADQDLVAVYTLVLPWLAGDESKVFIYSTPDLKDQEVRGKSIAVLESVLEQWEKDNRSNSVNIVSTFFSHTLRTSMKASDAKENQRPKGAKGFRRCRIKTH